MTWPLFILLLYDALLTTALILVILGIALFYQRSFPERTYPAAFGVALLLYGVAGMALIFYRVPAISSSVLLIGGTMLAVSSLRLYQTMTRKE